MNLYLQFDLLCPFNSGHTFVRMEPQVAGKGDRLGFKRMVRFSGTDIARNAEGH